MDDKAADLLRHSNTFRQEEITEEIEIFLFSAASIEEPRRSILTDRKYKAIK